MSALQGFRIVELAEGVAGEYCGKLLADFGAQVVKVERPDRGSPTRSMAPIVGGEGGCESSGLFAYLNTNKQSVTLDLASKDDVQLLHEIIATADAVIDDHDVSWAESIGLDAEEAERRHPSVIFCAITPFGRDAPADWRQAKSLNVFHTSGWGYHTPSEADAGKPPLKGAGRFLVDYDSGIDAALCLVSSLFWRARSKRGQHIDVSQQEVMLSRADIVLGRMMAGEVHASPARTAYDMQGPSAFFRCADGFVFLYAINRNHWNGLKTLMGDPAWMDELDDDWLEFAVTADRIADMRRRFASWVLPLNKDEVSEKAQRLGVPLVSVNDASDVQRSPQFQYRGYFQPLAHPVLGEANYPTVPYRLSASPAQLTSAAPHLGEHRDAIVQGLRDIANTALETAKPSRGGPLAGVRVVEITKVWAGPYAGKLLAFLGAEVIKVESNHNLDEMRAYGGVDINHAPYFLSLNPGIRSVQINMKSPKGLGCLRDLIAKSDIVIDNLRPGAMERSGLGYEDLRALKSDIISVSIKMFGNGGPLGYQTGYAPSFGALGGLSYLVGYEDGIPLGMNLRYGDSTVGANAAFAAVAALMHRERTGEGQSVDVSAVECMASMIGDSLLAYGLTGTIPGPDGNRHADMAPHGCYPCAGGEWISIAVASDEEWRSLCEAFQSSLAGDPAYATLSARQAHAERLDAMLTEWTRNEETEALATRLRAAGVAAFKSQSSQDLIGDRRLWDRDFFRFVTDNREGSRPIVGAPWRMSQAQSDISRGAPDLGEHNSYVYGDILGLSPEELQQLIADGVVD